MCTDASDGERDGACGASGAAAVHALHHHGSRCPADADASLGAAAAVPDHARQPAAAGVGFPQPDAEPPAPLRPASDQLPQAACSSMYVVTKTTDNQACNRYGF
mgnify:CR=1 FL=1